jgi:hypothetical protein
MASEKELNCALAGMAVMHSLDDLEKMLNIIPVIGSELENDCYINAQEVLKDDQRELRRALDAAKHSCGLRLEEEQLTQMVNEHIEELKNAIGDRDEEYALSLVQLIKGVLGTISYNGVNALSTEMPP